MTPFCAICLSSRAPFSHEPLGRNDGMVRVCLACASPVFARLYGEDEPIERPMIRIVPTAPRKPTKASADASAKRRRDVNRAYGRCINHPLTDKAKPHGPPQPGSVRCALCAAVHQGRRIA